LPPFFKRRLLLHPPLRFCFVHLDVQHPRAGGPLRRWTFRITCHSWDSSFWTALASLRVAASTWR
jgi:hypothetical protein